MDAQEKAALLAEIDAVVGGAAFIPLGMFSGSTPHEPALLAGANARDAGFEITVTKIGENAGRGRRRKSTDISGTDDRRREVTPKYHNPDKHSEKWSGRGRKPKWVQDLLASGKSLDDLLIRPERAAAAN